MEKKNFSAWGSGTIPKIQLKVPLSNARILKKEMVNLVSEDGANTHSEEINGQHATLRLEKQGNVLKSIQVNCVCGRQTNIVLEYDKESLLEKDLIPNPKVH